MENKKDIGLAFREKLNNMDKMPNDDVWKSISADLDKKKRRRFALFFLSTAVGIMLVLLGILMSRTYFIPQQKESTGTAVPKQKNMRIVVFDTPELQSKTQIDTTFKSKKVTKSRAITTKKLVKSTNEIEEYEVVTRYKIYVKKSKSAIITTTKTVSSKSKTSSENKSLKSIKSVITPKGTGLKTRKVTGKKTAAAKTYKSKKKKAIVSKMKTYKPKQIASKATTKKTFIPKENTIELEKPDSISVRQLPVIKKDSLQYLVLKEAKEKTDTVKKKKREYKPQKPLEKKEYQSYASIFAGPDYYNSFSDASSLIKTGNDFEKKGGIAFTYGIYGRMMFNEKIGIRIGFASTTAAYTTTIPYEKLFNTTNIDFSGGFTHEELNAYYTEGQKIDLLQKSQYFEIPVELYYVVNDETKIGTSIFAGLSGNFLGKNSITTTAGSKKIDLGKAMNLKQFVPSLNFGVLFNYKLTEKLQCDLSPLINYQLSPFSSNTAFKPLLFALQAGITYKL